MDNCPFEEERREADHLARTFLDTFVVVRRDWTRDNGKPLTFRYWVHRARTLRETPLGGPYEIVYTASPEGATDAPL